MICNTWQKKWRNVRRATPSVLGLVALPAVQAHCPLCTIGAAAAAGGAAYLGVDQGPIGVFVGAFSIAIALWVARLIKKDFPAKAIIIALVSYLTTVLPLIPLMKQNSPFFVGIAGSYGTMLNTTYVINSYLVGSMVGAVIMLTSPYISKLVSKKIGKTMPYQGLSITFGLLLVSALILQVIL